MRRVPRVALEIRRLHFARDPAAELAELVDVEFHPERRVALQICDREVEEPHRRPEPPPVLRVIGLKEVLLQMHECAGHLDQTLEKAVVVALRLQPEILQDVVRRVVLLVIKAGEIPSIAPVEGVSRIGAELFEKGGDSFVFFHRAGAAANYPHRPCGKQAAFENPSLGGPGRIIMAAGEFALVALILLVLAASSALFSAIETSLFSLQPFHIERLKARRASFATALGKLMENPRRLLSAILLADALANLPLIILCLALLREHQGPNVPFWAAALLIFGVVVFLCDLVPKLIALTDPYRVAKIGVRVMSVLTPVFDPAARLLQKWSEGLAEAITPAALKSGHFLNEDELGTLVELSTEEGALHETESEMISEIIKLGDKTAKDCMTPRVDAFAVPDDLTNEELIPRLRERRYRRVTVYGETPDDILGVLDVGSFLLDPSAHYTERLVPPSFVPETMKAIELLRSFLTHPQAIAIVVDEHGGTEGIVTLADIVEEIISDAVPRGDRELYIETLGPGRLLVNGAARIDDLNELLSTHLEAEGIDTIGGYVFNRLGALPKPGVQVEIDGLKLLVRRTSRKRIEELLIEHHETVEFGDDEDGEEEAP